MIYLRLFWEFFKTGLFAVGGGLATLPFIYDMSDRTGWFTYQQIADMIAVSESTPGPIGVNTSTYVGYITGGLPGSIIATLGLVTPAVIIILIIASCLKKFRENRFVDHAFYGLRPASTAMVAAAGLCRTYRGSGLFGRDARARARGCIQGKRKHPRPVLVEGACACGGDMGAHESCQKDKGSAPDSLHRGLGRRRNTRFLKYYRCAEQRKRRCHKRDHQPSDHVSGGFYIRAGDHGKGLKMNRKPAPGQDKRRKREVQGAYIETCHAADAVSEFQYAG